MSAGRVIFITGKGGVGKTTISAAVASALAARGDRTLVVETAGDGSLARLFDTDRLSAHPRELAPRLWGVHVDEVHLIRDYFSRLLKVPFLTARLLDSTSFRALTAAAPGIREFLLLERIATWVDAKFWQRQQRFEFVVVDGPASGHMRKLLRVPRQLLNLVVAGPLRRTALHLEALLTDSQRCVVVPVSLAEELAVQETIETWAVLRQELFLQVAPPVVNRVFPHRFSSSEAKAIAATPDRGPLLDAARYALGMHTEAQRHVRALRAATGQPPIVVAEHFSSMLDRRTLLRLGRQILRQIGRHTDWSELGEQPTAAREVRE